MKIPTKFEMNTEDFKIYFDNSKKTHVCESLETGEKTNIGVLGILMQMGILKSLEEDRKTDVRLSVLSEKVESLEKKIDDVLKNLTAPEAKVAERKDVVIKEMEKKKEPEIKKRIMKKVLGETVPEPEKIEEKAIEEDSEEEEVSEEPSDVLVESKEEINNWMDI